MSKRVPSRSMCVFCVAVCVVMSVGVQGNVLILVVSCYK